MKKVLSNGRPRKNATDIHAGKNCPLEIRGNQIRGRYILNLIQGGLMQIEKANCNYLWLAIDFRVETYKNIIDRPQTRQVDISGER